MITSFVAMAGTACVKVYVNRVVSGEAERWSRCFRSFLVEFAAEEVYWRGKNGFNKNRKRVKPLRR